MTNWRTKVSKSSNSPMEKSKQRKLVVDSSDKNIAPLMNTADEKSPEANEDLSSTIKTPVEEIISKPYIARVPCRFVLDEKQSFGMCYLNNERIMLYQDEDGKIYPEKYRIALEEGILKKDEDVSFMEK
jgi:hypothetical protein